MLSLTQMRNIKFLEQLLVRNSPPPYACRYMDYIEDQFLKNEQIQPWIWLRYIDDIFFIQTASEKELDDFLERLNYFHLNVKFTHERFKEEINFLDVTVKVNHGELSPISTANLLMTISTISTFTSHTKSSIIFSRAMKMRIICSKKSNLFAHVRKLKDWFKERGYPEDMVNKEAKRVLESPSLGRSKTSERSVSGNFGNGVPLVVNYNPILCHLGQVIPKNLCFLHQDEEVKQVFNYSFCSVRTLRSHLKREKKFHVRKEVA